MFEFNAIRTIIVFCAICGMVSIADTKLQSSILPPSNTFTMPRVIINGSIIVGDLKSFVAKFNIPYVTC